MSALAFAAFRALGMGPSGRELALVAAALSDSNDEETLALFFERETYGDGYRQLADIAERAGAGRLVALDLYVEVLNRGALAATRRAARMVP